MFLYDIKGTTLKVYEFKSNKKDLQDYRIEQLSTIPENERILTAEAYTGPFEETPLLELYMCFIENVAIPIEYINSKEPDSCGRYHQIKHIDSISSTEIELLEAYYDGLLNNRKVVRVQDLNKIRYLLLRSNKYENDPSDSRHKIMKDIIELPESLYILQLLEQGNFHLIENEDISEQLSLYSIDIFNEFSLINFAKMDQCGITENIYERALVKSRKDSHILKLMKK